MINRLYMLAVVLSLFVACSTDDDVTDGNDGMARSEASPTDGVEVCVVFAPDELGDLGYADRVLAGLHLFDMQLGEADHERVQLRYIAVSNADAIHNELRHWNQQNTSPYTRCAYDRRLLVLTDVGLLPFLSDTPLADTDEVLVMNVTDDQFAQAPRTAELGSRLHLMSISAAGAARKLAARIDYETSHPEDNPQGREKSIRLFQGYEPGEVLADSIYEVLREHFANDADIITLHRNAMGKGNEGLNNTYQMAAQFQHTDASFCSYLVCSWGSYNTMLWSAFYTWGAGHAEVVFLDSSFIGNNTFPCILRHYDRALCHWLQRWFEAPAATMPAREWHGDWDGYVSEK